MEIKTLGGNGLHASETRAVRRMEKELRDSWFAYASLLVADDQGSMDVDVLIITHDRLLLVELKEWNGNLESYDGRWYIGGKPRSKSPYEIKRVHAIRIQNLLQRELEHKLGYFLNVEAHVVLCGTATPENITTSEKRYVHSLSEFLEIKTQEGYERIVSDKKHITSKLFDNNRKPRPNSSACLPVIKNFFAGTRVSNKEFHYHHFIAEKKPWFIHRNKLFEEYKGYHEENSKEIALMRRWNFNHLGVGHATQDQWANIALRESRIISHVKQHSNNLEEYLLRPKIPLGIDDVTEDVTELYELRRTYSRLDEYIDSELPRKSPEERIDVLRALLAPFSELHALGIGHRDIDGHNLWYASEQKSIIVSGLSTAYFPEKGTVKDLRSILQATNIKLPEELLSDKGDILDPFRQDVFLLANIGYRVCYPGAYLPRDENIPLWEPPKCDQYEGMLSCWFEKALAWEPSERYRNATDMLSELNKLNPSKGEEGAQENQEIINSIMTGSFVKRNWGLFNIYSSYPPKPGENPGGGEKVSYACFAGDDSAYCKIWPFVKTDPINTGVNRRIENFRFRAEKIIEANLPSPPILEYGLMEGGGLFIITSFVEGLIWSNLNEIETNTLSNVRLCKSLAKSVLICHEQGIAHGDLHPDNILIKEAHNELEEPNRIILLDMLDFGYKSEPYNIEYSPKNPSITDAMGRDRFAVYKLTQELVGKDAPLAIQEEIRRGFGSPDGVPVSLEALDQVIEKALNPAVEQAAGNKELSFTWPSQELDVNNNTLKILQDGNCYHFNCRWNRRDPDLLDCYITGSNAYLQVRLDPAKRQIRYAQLNKNISIGELVSASTKSQIEIKDEITFVQGSPSKKQTEIFIDMLFSLDPVLTALEERYSTDEDTYEHEHEYDDSEDVPPVKIWQSLIKTENELLLSLEVAEGKIDENENGRIVVPYILENGSSLDFDHDEIVFVYLEGDEQAIGELDIASSTVDYLAVIPKRPGLSRIVSKGKTIKLDSLRNKASRDRKEKALNRVIDRGSTIPNLVDFFNPKTAPTTTNLAERPDDEHLRQLYNKEGQELNTKQILAFQQLIEKGPISVLQGPPGTGKTAFISFFIHYLFQYLNVKNVLLVGQSHTSVDNVAVKVREACIDREQSLSIVRIGPEGMITTSLLDSHPRAIQRQIRHSFHREYDKRIRELSAHMLLPTAFVEEVTSIHRNIVPVIDSINIYDKTLKEVRGESENSTFYKERVLTEKNAANRLISNFVSSRFPEDYEDIISSDDIWKNILNIVAKRHGVNNPSALNRLDSLLNMSHDWLNVLKTGEANYDQFLVQTRKLVCGTLVGIGKKQIAVEDSEFDWVIVDEAARAQGSELLIAMQSAKRVLLVGDHKQLPPHYDKQHLKLAAKSLGNSLDPYLITDFERLYKSTSGITLDTQYRMCKPISNIVSACFYKDEVGSLHTGRPSSPEWYSMLDKPLNRSVSWVDSSSSKFSTGEEEIGKGKYINRHEAYLVIDILKSLSQAETLENLRMSIKKEQPYTIGIITMYRAQKEFLEQELSKAEWAAFIRDMIKIDTVDSYQGQENKIIILSLVRDNLENKQGFLVSKSRINVAISRAQERLVILGSRGMWGAKNAKSALGSVLQYIEKQVLDTNQKDYQIISDYGRRVADVN